MYLIWDVLPNLWEIDPPKYKKLLAICNSLLQNCMEQNKIASFLKITLYKNIGKKKLIYGCPYLK